MRRRPVFIALAIASLHAVWLATKAGGEAGVTAASDLIQFLAIAVAACACIIRARNERGADRLAWGLLAGCTAAWAVGAGIWSYYEVVLRVDAPFPSLADAGFLAAVPLAAAGILAFPALRNAYSRPRSLLDRPAQHVRGRVHRPLHGERPGSPPGRPRALLQA